MGVVPDLVEGDELVGKSVGGDGCLGDFHPDRSLHTRQLPHLGPGEGDCVVGQVGRSMVIGDLVVVEVIVMVAGNPHRLDRRERRR